MHMGAFHRLILKLSGQDIRKSVQKYLSKDDNAIHMTLAAYTERKGIWSKTFSFACNNTFWGTPRRFH